jgi:hypothetical protein
MIALGESQALEGISTNATEVTYTISGCLVTPGTPPSAANYEVLAQGQLAATAGSLYNPGASNYALISSIHLFNNDTIAQTVTLYVEGTAAANAIATFSIPAGGFAIYEDGQGWQVYSSAGAPITSAAPTIASTYIGSTVSIGATTITNVTSLTLSAGTWLIIGTCLSKLATATLGHADFWLGPNSASKTGAYVAATCSMGDIAGGTEEDTASLITVQTFTASQTVYLTGYASEATTAEPTTTEETISNATGILAIQLV